MRISALLTVLLLFVAFIFGFVLDAYPALDTTEVKLWVFGAVFFFILFTAPILWGDDAWEVMVVFFGATYIPLLAVIAEWGSNCASSLQNPLL